MHIAKGNQVVRSTYAKIKINHHKVIIAALLDSGSEISVISSALAKKLDLIYEIDPQWKIICGIGGRTIASFEKVDTFFNFVNEDNGTSSRDLAVHLSVIDRGPMETVTLGLDVLKTYNLLLDYRARYSKSPSIITDPLTTPENQIPVSAPIYTMCTKEDKYWCQLNSTIHNYCPFIKISIKGQQNDILALIDSGAQISVVRLEVIKDSNLENEIKTLSKPMLQGIAENPIMAIGTINLSLILKHSRKEIQEEFLVINEGKLDMILGMNLLSKWNLYIRHPCDTVSNDEGIEEKIYYPDTDPYFACIQAHFSKTFNQAREKTLEMMESTSEYLKECKNQQKHPPTRILQHLNKIEMVVRQLELFQKDHNTSRQEQTELQPTTNESSRNRSNIQSSQHYDYDDEEFAQNILITPEANDPPSNTDIGQHSDKSELPTEWTLKTIKHVTVPASSESTIWLTLHPKLVEFFEGAEAILEPYNRENSPMKVGVQIFVIGEKIPVRIINICDQPLPYHKNCKMGKITILPREGVVQPVKNVSTGKIPTQTHSQCMQIKTITPPAEGETQRQIEDILQTHEWTKEINISDKLSIQERLEILLLIVKHQKAFSTSKFDLGLTKEIEFEIKTTNTAPITVPPYRLAYQKKQILKDLIPEMLEAKIIEPSVSNWNNPIVLVRKQNGEYRLCIDMRKINEVTVPMNLPIPNITECLDILKDKNFFSSLDLNSAYHQIQIKKEDRHKTAFMINNRKYQYRTMLFGAKNAPFYWAYLMERVLGSMNFLKLLVYLDDILVFSKEFSTHLSRLQETFEKLISANLKLKPAKCSFAHSQTKFLGFIISRRGMIPNPMKIRAITKIARPRCLREVQRFNGLLNFYSRWLSNWQKTALPLTELTKKNVPFIWTEACETSFNILKAQLCNAPVLQGPDFQRKFIVSCDASLSSSGASLIQKGDMGREYVIAYYSKKFSPTEFRYGATEKELLSLLNAIEFFKNYIWGRHFTVRTDCKALTYYINLKVTQARGARWRTMLGEYDFDLEHVPGKEHVEADYLSRTPENDWKIDIYKNPRTVIYLSEEVDLEDIKIWRENVATCLKFSEKEAKYMSHKKKISTPEKESLFKAIGSALFLQNNNQFIIQKTLREYMYRHRNFYYEHSHRVIENDDQSLPDAIDITALSSMIKIPILIRSSRRNRIFLPVTETTVKSLPPLGAVLILRFNEESGYTWENKSYSNDTGEDLLEEVLETTICEGNDEEVEAWVTDQEKTLKEYGIDDLPQRPKDIRSLNIDLVHSEHPPSDKRIIDQTKNTVLNIGTLTRLPDPAEIVKMQSQDEYCQEWRKYKETGLDPKLKKAQFARHRENVEIDENGILILKKKQTRRNTDKNKESALIFLPLSMAKLVLTLAHDENGHFGVHKVVHLISQRFFRENPSIRSIVTDYIQGCLPCKSKVGGKEPKQAEVQQNYLPEDRFRAWAIDHVKICRSHQGNEYVLSMSDLFSRYTMVWPVPDTGVKATVDAILINIVRIFGFPEILMSDRGSAFTSEVYNELTKLLKITVKRTTALNPACNGLVERFNKSLGDMLRTAALEDPRNWEDLIPILTLAYNCSYNRTIEDTPFYTTFGKDARLALDMIVPRRIEHPYSIGLDNAFSPAAELQGRMQKIRDITHQHITKNLEINRAKVNKTRKTREFKIGDKVLLKVPPKKGTKKKFHRKYKGVFRVERILNDVTIEIKSVTGLGKVQTVHQNRLMHFSTQGREDIISWAEAYEDVQSKSKPRN